MKIAFESELMQNQKHAVVMAPDHAFEVLQSQDGDSLFFSLGTDHVLYLTREVSPATTGWTKLALSAPLAAQHAGAAVKDFAVTQNPQTLGIDLALVLTVGGVDSLYLSLGNANTDAAWADGVSWTAVPFDAGTAPSPLTIADVLLLNLLTPDGSGGTTENIFVDILRAPGNGLQLLDRYYLTPGQTPQWNAHALPADLAAGTVHNCLGCRTGDPLPGIYTFGAINGKPELFYTEQFNYFQANVPPTPAYLSLPAGASAVASALNAAGVTNLFVAGTAGLFVFTPDNQHNQATPVPIATGGPTAGAQALAAATAGGKTAVWGLNPQGNLFYLSCPAGSEASAAAWSPAVPLLTQAEGFAFFLNLQAGNNVLFAHVDGSQLVQLTQDTLTANWQQRSILLPSTDPDDMAVYNSFTTHIQVTDDFGVGSPGAAVSVTATSAVSVYLNDIYHVLSPTVPVLATADATGVLTVVQETQALTAVCLQATLTNTPQVVADINPMSKALAKLSTVQTGADLSQVKVTNSDGTQQPLVPADVSSGDKDVAAKSLAQFSQIAGGLPADGSRQPPTTAARSAAAVAAPATAAPRTTVWGVSFGGGLRYHEGADAAQLLASAPAARAAGPNVAMAATMSLDDVGNSIEMAAEDLFRWIKSGIETIEHFVVQEAEGLYHFLVRIGEAVYDAVLDCVNAVVQAVEFVFNQIKVFFEDLIKWLGFLFEWNDILRTHKVLKNVFKQSAIRAVGRLVTIEQDVVNMFQGLEQKIDAWAGIPSSPATMGSYQSSSATAPGAGSPQSHWALHHTKSNIGSATTQYSTPSTSLDPLQQIFTDLQQLVVAEVDDLLDAIKRLKTEVIDPIATLTVDEVIKRIAAIIGDAILTAAQDIIVTALDIVRVVVTGIIDLLDAPISIPILSSIYRDIAGAELSFLDLVCLVGAIPTTIMYKIVLDRAPFTDAEADALGNAPDFDSLQRVLTGGAAAPQARMAAATAQVAAAAPSSSPSLLDTLTLLSNFTAMFGAFGVALMAALKKTETEVNLPPPAPLRYLAAAFYLPYVGPNLTQAFSSSAGQWYTIMNDVVTTLAIGKTLADNSDTLSDPTKVKPWTSYGSPGVESFLNLVWLAPAIGGIIENSSRKTSDWLSLAGNISFDLGGIITIGSEKDIVQNEEVALGFFVAIEILNVGYGLLSAGTGVALAGHH